VSTALHYTTTTPFSLLTNAGAIQFRVYKYRVLRGVPTCVFVQPGEYACGPVKTEKDKEGELRQGNVFVAKHQGLQGTQYIHITNK
jgi:hypothetical protein